MGRVLSCVHANTTPRMTMVCVAGMGLSGRLPFWKIHFVCIRPARRVVPRVFTQCVKDWCREWFKAKSREEREGHDGGKNKGYFD